MSLLLIFLVLMIPVIQNFLQENLREGVDRVHQLRTLGDLGQLALALEGFKIRNGGYPVGDDWKMMSNMLAQENLIPLAILEDGWSRQFLYQSLVPAEYELKSCGRDGVCAPAISQGSFQYTEWERDLVLRSGRWWSWPNGGSMVDLSLELTDGEEAVRPGQSVVYSLTVSNLSVNLQESRLGGRLKFYFPEPSRSISWPDLEVVNEQSSERVVTYQVNSDLPVETEEVSSYAEVKAIQQTKLDPDYSNNVASDTNLVKRF